MSIGPNGLRNFETEWKQCRIGELEGVPTRILPLSRVIASKRAANREKDIAVLPILTRTLRMSKRLEKGSKEIAKPKPSAKKK